jgi:hypothetical protein
VQSIQKYDDRVRVLGIEATQNKSIEGGGATAQNVVYRPTADLGSDSVPNRHTNKSRHHPHCFAGNKKVPQDNAQQFLTGAW